MSIASRFAAIKTAWAGFVKRNVVDDNPFTYQEEVTAWAQRDAALVPALARPYTIQGRFLEFHAANPQVYENLVELAYAAKDAGFKCYSINSLVERLRWHYNIDIRTDGFKIDNSFRANYSRLIMQQEPGLAGFFHTRIQTAA